jgi:pyruvate/2-oxoglutarate dehydrogenase complex dihydrolipoamide acyltransferase (E2) component
MLNKILKIFPTITDANSQSLYIGQIHVKNGELVNKDQIIVTYESSKKSYDLTAVQEGFIYLNCKSGEVVSLDLMLGLISEKKLSNDEVLAEFATKDKNSNHLKITSKALKMMKEFSINPNDLGSEREISFEVVNSYLSKTKKIQIVEINKETKALCENIEPNSFSSFLSININEEKMQNNLKKISGETLGVVSLDAFIAFKAHSVLVNYLNLSSYFNEKNIIKVESCPVGIYMHDETRGVPVVVEASSLKKINDTVNKIFELQKEIISNSFSQEDLCCFYISNLSEKNIINFIPLLKKKSAATLAVCSSFNGFRLIGISFDHRLMEGSYVADFLNDLKNEIEGK